MSGGCADDYSALKQTHLSNDDGAMMTHIHNLKILPDMYRKRARIYRIQYVTT